MYRAVQSRTPYSQYKVDLPTQAERRTVSIKYIYLHKPNAVQSVLSLFTYISRTPHSQNKVYLSHKPNAVQSV